MFTCCVLSSLLWWLVGAHVNHTHEIKAEMLKQRWEVENVVRDLDHLKEDLANIVELVDVGKLTAKEIAFYMIRMHDFDDNGSLDGIEIRVAAAHSMEHHASQNNSKEETEERIEDIIDKALAFDLNDDGFVDFGEFLRQFPSSETEQK